MPKTTSKIFLDTSVVLAAYGSESGGSSLIINNQGKVYCCIVSIDVVVEALSKADKFGATEEDIKNWIKDKKILVTKSPTPEEKSEFDDVTVDKKDRHILAATKREKAEFLLSLDRKHIIKPKIKRAMEPVKIMTPKEFLQKKPIN